MSVMRHVVIAAVVAACLPAALAISSCPSATDQAKRLYANASLMCASGLACHSTYCSCIGAATASNLTCTTPTTAPNCSVAQMCVGAFIKCTNNASDSGCPGLRELHMSLLTVQSGTRWNASAAWQGCAWRACQLVNSSTGGANCTVDVQTACPSPVQFTAQLRLSGNFSWMIGNLAALATLTTGMTKDLSRELRAFVRIVRMFINGNVAGRQSGSDSLVVDFVVPGVTARNAEFAALFAQLAAAGSSILTETQAAYLAAGGTGTLTLVGVTATGSSASGTGSTPSGSGSNSPTSAAGSNPAGSNVTNPGSTTGSSGASAHSFVVAVVLAAVSALLF